MHLRRVIPYTAHVAGDEWLSTAQAAAVLGVSRSTVLRSLQDETRRAKWWGAQGEGWRYRPLSDETEPIYQVRRSWAEKLAGTDPDAGD
jgi:hypothetical protein